MKIAVAISFVLVVLCCALSAQAAPGQIWAWCGAASDTLMLKNITISPNPPQSGAAFSAAITGLLKQDLTTGSSGHVDVNYGDDPLYSFVNGSIFDVKEITFVVEILICALLQAEVLDAP